MKQFNSVLRFVLLDILRRKVIFAYAAFLFLIASGMFYFSGEGEKAVLSIMNILFLIVPLMCIIFGTSYLYNAREFIVLLLAQPVSRKLIFAGQFYGLALSLCLALLAGAGLPMLLFSSHPTAWMLLALGMLLTLVFTALALWIALLYNDKAKGTGISLITWFFFAFLFDGLILLIVLYFSDYPVEPFVVGLSLLNPLDIARVALMMKLSAAAMMGYTAAVYAQWFGHGPGLAFLSVVLVCWCIVPAWLAKRRFMKKDF